MKTAVKRALGVGGALALAASAVIVPATAAQADGGYYGAWTLTAWKLGNKTIECPGKLPLPPPAPSISCKGGETLDLNSDYTYKTTLDVFRGKSGKGEFEVIKFSTNKYHTIIFDSYDVQDDPRSYQVKFQGTTSAGTPKKMVVFTTVGRPGGEDTLIKMIFRRDAD
ncbi:MAG: hypothetical protein RL134_103 [Actinomycetota bacterium]